MPVSLNRSNFSVNFSLLFATKFDSCDHIHERASVDSTTRTNLLYILTLRSTTVLPVVWHNHEIQQSSTLCLSDTISLGSTSRTWVIWLSIVSRVDTRPAIDRDVDIMHNNQVIVQLPMNITKSLKIRFQGDFFERHLDLYEPFHVIPAWFKFNWFAFPICRSAGITLSSGHRPLQT